MSTSEGGGEKKFGRLLHRTLLRTKEKMMAGLGKTDRTQDNDFEKHATLFHEQQNTANNLFKTFRNYANQVKATSAASRAMHQTMSDAFEYSWEGVEEFIIANEHLNSALEKYNTHLNEYLYQQILEYANKFPDVKAKILKRGRKLVDYDSARHSQQSFANAKKKNEYKMNNAQRELTSSKIIYDNINSELMSELPLLHQSRIPTLSSYFSNLLNAQSDFHDEMHKITSKLADMTSDIKVKKSFAAIAAGLDDKTGEGRGDHTNMEKGIRPLGVGGTPYQMSPYNGTQTGTTPYSNSPGSVVRGGVSSLAQTNSDRRAAYYTGKALSGSFERNQGPDLDYQNLGEVNREPRVAPVRRSSSGRKNAGTLPTAAVSTENRTSGGQRSMTLLSKAMEQRSPAVKQIGNPFEDVNATKYPPVIPPPPNIIHQYNHQVIPPPPSITAEPSSNTIQNSAKSATSAINSSASSASDSTSSTASTVVEATSSAIGSLNSAANTAVSSANAAAGSASSAVISAANTAVNAASNSAESANSALNSVTSSIANAVSSATNSAINAVSSAGEQVGADVEPVEVYKVMAMHDYEAVESDELSLKAGDVIEIIPTDESKPNLEEGWQLGVRISDKKKGIFPVNFTKLID